jgi:hypothetical protein
MEIVEIIAALLTVLGFFGTAAIIVRTVTNSPRRRALAEAEKQERLKDLGLLDPPGGTDGLMAQLQERDAKITELTEERDFLRRLLEEREPKSKSAPDRDIES